MHDIDIEGSPDRNPEIPQPEFTRALWWPLFCSVHSNRKSQKRKNPAEVTTICVYVVCGHFLVSVFVLTHQQDMVSRQCPYHALSLVLFVFVVFSLCLTTSLSYCWFVSLFINSPTRSDLSSMPLSCLVLSSLCLCCVFFVFDYFFIIMLICFSFY